MYCYLFIHLFVIIIGIPELSYEKQNIAHLENVPETLNEEKEDKSHDEHSLTSEKNFSLQV